VTSNPNFRTPDGSPLPEWANGNPDVIEAARKYAEGRRAAAEYGKLDLHSSSMKYVEDAVRKLADELVAAVEKCRPPEPLTWEKLCELEPGLKSLERRVLALAKQGRRRNFCANAAWFGYGNFYCYDSPRQRLPQLVGWFRPKNTGDPDGTSIRSSEAYDVAYQHLYGLLPNCRRCGCL
jgi:hypothetical protein